MKIREKLLALFLSATITFSALPATLAKVIADETEPTESTTVIEETTEESVQTEETSVPTEATTTEQTAAPTETSETTEETTEATEPSSEETYNTAVRGTINDDFEVTRASYVETANGSYTYTISFTGAKTGEFDFVSVVIRDESFENEVHYERLSNGVESGTITYTLPLLDPGIYHIYFYSESLKDANDSHPYVRYGVSYYTKTFVKKNPHFEDSHSITLDGGRIGINFYVNPINESLSDMKVVFSQQGKSDVTFQMEDAVDAEYKNSTVYKAQYYVNAKEMTDVITAKLYLDDELMAINQYSVRDYYDMMRVDEYGDNPMDYKLSALLESLMLYGGYSQQYFGYNTGNLASKGVSRSLTSVPDNSLYASSISGQVPSGLTIEGVSVLLKSTNSIRVYFTIPSGESISSYNFTIGDSSVNANLYSGNTYYIETSGIQIHKLSELIKFTISDGSRTWTLNYCPMSYAYTMQTDTSVGNICKAMYMLNASAIAYVNRTGTYRPDFAKEVLDLVNAERAAATAEDGISRPTLVWSNELERAANIRANEIALQFTHERLDGATCFTASAELKGENIAAGQMSPEDVVNSWMNSPGHRKNILDPSYRYMGVGCYSESGTRYSNGGRGYYWAQEFGR